MANILVIDDDLESLVPLALALEGDGHRICMTGDARRAVDLMHGEFIECVITDYEMPHLDGVQLCRVMRSNPRLAAIPALLLSAAPEPVASDRCWARFFRKPIAVNELLEEVNRLMAMRLAAPAVRSGVTSMRANPAA